MLKTHRFHSKLVLRTPLKGYKLEPVGIDTLKTFFEIPSNAEALYLASPALHTEYIRWQKEGLPSQKEEDKLVFALLKYYLRLHSRCTPFGLFAGCNIANWGDENLLDSGDQMHRETRLDMHYAVSLAQHISVQPFVKPYLEFRTNSALYKMGDKHRFVEYFYRNKSRVHQISSVDASEYLDRILEKALEGGYISELADTIVDEDISKEEALGFVDELIDNQIIVSALEPSVTGDDLLSQIRTILQNVFDEHPHESLKILVEQLTRVQRLLDELDKRFGNQIEDYQLIIDVIKEIGVPFEENKLFQTDLFIDTGATTVQSNVKSQINRVLAILHRLMPTYDKTNLDVFKEAFVKRYGTSEVLLLHALDAESGLGYASNSNSGDLNPLVDDLRIQIADDENKINWSVRDSMLLKKLTTAIKKNQTEINITDADIQQLSVIENNLPDSMHVMFSVDAATGKIFLRSASGSSAANILGRFGSGNEKIKDLLKDITKHESSLHPNAVLAEIVHLPENRVGNILMRPTLRSYEIPYLSKASVNKDNEIALQDIYVSVVEDSVVLRSKRLNKAVLPRMSNAHNYSYNALPVYHFLCDVQHQKTQRDLFFDWGPLQREFTFLPRVKVKDTVVFPATWNIYGSALETLKKDSENALENFDSWRHEQNLPEQFVLVNADNKLLIDASNALAVKMFIYEIRNEVQIQLEELIGLTHNSAGVLMANEFIGIIEKENATDRPFKQNTVEATPNAVQSDWVYYRLYCGAKTSDALLSVIASKAKEYMDQELVSHWFFIRYQDPDMHLRIRFRLTDMVHMGFVVQDFLDVLTPHRENGQISKIVLDSYEPEYERYGYAGMQLSEYLFWFDSHCCVQLLENLSSEKNRWLTCIYSVHKLLLDFGCTLETRTKLLKELKTVFAEEFQMNKYLKQQLSAKYRENRSLIDSILEDPTDLDPDLIKLFELVDTRSVNNEPIVQELQKLDTEGVLDIAIQDLMPSYIHMLVNRIFRNKQRVHEMVIYDFMWRTYNSALARTKNEVEA